LKSPFTYGDGLAVVAAERAEIDGPYLRPGMIRERSEEERQ
jgi:hypothetical protein